MKKYFIHFLLTALLVIPVTAGANSRMPVEPVGVGGGSVQTDINAITTTTVRGRNSGQNAVNTPSQQTSRRGDPTVNATPYVDPGTLPANLLLNDAPPGNGADAQNNYIAQSDTCNISSFAASDARPAIGSDNANTTLNFNLDGQSHDWWLVDSSGNVVTHGNGTDGSINVATRTPNSYRLVCDGAQTSDISIVPQGRGATDTTPPPLNIPAHNTPDSVGSYKPLRTTSDCHIDSLNSGSSSTYTIGTSPSLFFQQSGCSNITIVGGRFGAGSSFDTTKDCVIANDQPQCSTYGLTEDTSFIVQGSDAQGHMTFQTITVHVVPPVNVQLPNISDFSTSTDSKYWSPGQCVPLQWDIQNGAYAVVTSYPPDPNANNMLVGQNHTTIENKGGTCVYPTKDESYTITVYPTYGAPVTKTVAVRVVHSNQNFSGQPETTTPVLQTSTTELSFNATPGQVPGAQTFQISNTVSGGAMSSSMPFTIATDQPWCHASIQNTGATSGTLGGQASKTGNINVAVTVDPHSASGSFGCNVVVTAPDSQSGTTRTVSVIENVYAAGVTPAAPVLPTLTSTFNPNNPPSFNSTGGNIPYKYPNGTQSGTNTASNAPADVTGHASIAFTPGPWTGTAWTYNFSYTIASNQKGAYLRVGHKVVDQNIQASGTASSDLLPSTQYLAQLCSDPLCNDKVYTQQNLTTAAH